MGASLYMRNKRHNPTNCSLTLPQTCPTKQDHLWEHMIEDRNIAFVTPYSKIKQPLPSKKQLKIIATLSNNAFLVGSYKATKAVYDQHTDNLLRKIGRDGDVIRVTGSYGRITARSPINNPNGIWGIELDGEVHQIKRV